MAARPETRPDPAGLKTEDGDHEPRTMDGLQTLEKAMRQALP